MRKSVLVLLFSLCVFNAKAQNVYVSALKNCRWVAVDAEYFDSKGGELVLMFTDSLYIQDIRFTKDGETVRRQFPYYLSDVKPEAFDSMRVGKNSSGKYIVAKQRIRSINEMKWSYKTVAHEILGYSETKLTMKFPSGNVCIFRKEPLR